MKTKKQLAAVQITKSTRCSSSRQLLQMKPARTSSNNLYQKLILMDNEAQTSSYRVLLLLGLMGLLVLSTRPNCSQLQQANTAAASMSPSAAAATARRAGPSTTSTGSSGSSIMSTYFPHVQRQCALNGSSWLSDYAAYHAAVLTGKAPPRYLVSVAVQAGLADRITGVWSVPPSVPPLCGGGGQGREGRPIAIGRGGRGARREHYGVPQCFTLSFWGKAPLCHLVSVAVQAGLADRISGALLSFEAVCDKPLRPPPPHTHTYTYGLCHTDSPLV
jgi:hypothetical protein